MLTLEDRSKFEALVADYAKAEIAWRQAVERRHAALHAILDCTNNKLSATTRGAIEHGVALERSKQDARKLHLTKILGKIAEGTRDVRTTLSPAEVFELACEGLNHAPEKNPPQRPAGSQDFSGPLPPDPYLDCPTVTDRRVGMRPELAAGFGEETPFPIPGFNKSPSPSCPVIVLPPGVKPSDFVPLNRKSDTSPAFDDTFADLGGLDTAEMPEAQQLGLSHKAKV